MEFRLALSDGSVRLFERDGDAGVYSERLLETWTPAQLAALRSRNSELVEGIKKLADKCKAKTLTNIMSREVDIWQAMAYGEIADELESILTPDPAKG